tara:strand:+ start:211 stop:537 length:327 start_codon:yes stop_codon:yes gene_type:complete
VRSKEDTMELIYTGLLLHKANKEINEDNVKKVLDAAGIEKPEGDIKATVAALKGVNIDETIKEASVAPVAAVAQSAGQEAGAKEEKKEPEEEKKSAEDAAAGLGSLFG